MRLGATVSTKSCHCFPFVTNCFLNPSRCLRTEVLSKSHPKSHRVQSFEAPAEKNHLSVTKRVSLVMWPLAAPLGFEEWKGAHAVGDSMAGRLGPGVERGGGKGVRASFIKTDVWGLP